ncbi:hypothetical protein BGZ92_004336, partial [Podila epicladia]
LVDTQEQPPTATLLLEPAEHDVLGSGLSSRGHCVPPTDIALENHSSFFPERSPERITAKPYFTPISPTARNTFFVNQHD